MLCLGGSALETSYCLLGVERACGNLEMLWANLHMGKTRINKENKDKDKYVSAILYIPKGVY